MIEVKVKAAKLAYFKLRARFIKLQRVIIGEGLMDASEPIVRAAMANAPVLTRRLRGRIGPTLMKQRGGMAVAIGAIRHNRNDKQFPFYDRFQERGFRAMGRASRNTIRGPARQIPGRRFLEKAGVSQAGRAQEIFARKIFQRFAEIQTAGEAAGLV